MSWITFSIEANDQGLVLLHFSYKSILAISHLLSIKWQKETLIRPCCIMDCSKPSVLFYYHILMEREAGGRVKTSLVGDLSILRDTKSKWDIISCLIFSSQYHKRYCKSFHCGPLHAERPKKYSVLTPEMYGEHPPSFFIGVSLGPIIYNSQNSTERFFHGPHFGQSWSLKHTCHLTPLFHCSSFVQDLHVVLLNLLLIHLERSALPLVVRSTMFVSPIP